MASWKRTQLCLCVIVYLFIIYETTINGNVKQKKCTKANECTVLYKDTDSKTMQIAFLKVPKTGSSTLQNIMFRFGLKNNLRVYIPNNKYFLSTEEQTVLMNTSASYDIFLIHTIYNTKFFRHFPKSKSATIGLIRNPYDRFISAAYYMRDVVHAKYLERIPKKNYIQNLLGNWDKYDKGYFSPTRNLMGKYFGFTHPVMENDTGEMKRYLDKVNSEIVLVLILERFEESLVLLRRLLKWSFLDILYFKLNSHAHEHEEVENSVKEKLKITSFLDDQIYTYFTNELDRKIAQAGPVFQVEVKHFKDILNKVKEFCSSDSNKSAYVVPRSRWEDKFTVRQDDCRNMMTNDTDFFKIFRTRQNGLQDT